MGRMEIGQILLKNEDIKKKFMYFLKKNDKDPRKVFDKQTVSKINHLKKNFASLSFGNFNSMCYKQANKKDGQKCFVQPKFRFWFLDTL